MFLQLGKNKKPKICPLCLIKHHNFDSNRGKEENVKAHKHLVDHTLADKARNIWIRNALKINV
jgi:hypothetical protein